MLWAGADPRSDGPMPGEPDDSESYTAALKQVGYKGNLTIPKCFDRNRIEPIFPSLITSNRFSSRLVSVPKCRPLSVNRAPVLGWREKF
jgi:hypothetical protein